MLIAVDAHGGDYAPREIIKGAIEAAEDYKLDIALVGRKSVLGMLLRSQGKKSNLTVINASQIIEHDEPPIEAVKSKPDSSVVVGMRLVKEGIASAFVSAGSTGATVVAAFLNLGIVEGIQRAPISVVVRVDPANPFLLVDIGVNVDCRPSFLVQFGQLATVLARGILSINSPRVALLNNGEEEIKGNLLTKDAHQLFRKSDLNFIGNIEPQEILDGKADVVVTDGFTGNIVIKTIEACANTFESLVGAGQASRVDSQLTGRALVNYVEMTSRVKRLDFREYGGGFLLGVNGNVVVAHGRSQAKAIKSAIYLAHQVDRMRIVETIKNGQFVSI